MAPISRYRPSDEVLAVTGLRVTPAVTGQVRHTVQDGDRLDRLAALYYGEPRLWWRICDANPQAPWPPDLLGRGPVRTLRVVLGEPRRWPDALPDLAAAAWFVDAHLAEPPADSDAPADLALVRFNRLVADAVEVVAALRSAGLVPGRFATAPVAGSGVDVPPRVGG